MSKFKITAQSQGIKDMVVDFEKLTKAEQQFIQKTLSADKSIKKKTKEGSIAYGKLKGAVRDVGNVVIGVFGASGAGSLAQRFLDDFNKKIENTIRLQKQAFTAQESLEQAAGLYMKNNPETNVKNLEGLKEFAIKESATSSGITPAEVFRAFTSASGAAGNVDQKILEKAISRAIKIDLRLDKESDVAAIATANAVAASNLVKSGRASNAEQGLKFSENLITVLGQKFAGNADKAGKNFTPLLGFASDTFKGDPSKMASLFTFASRTLQDSEGSSSSNSLTPMFKNIGSRELKLGGKAVSFKSLGPVERLLEISERIDSGEFGNSAKALGELSPQLGGGEKGSIILSQLFNEANRSEITADAKEFSDKAFVEKSLKQPALDVLDKVFNNAKYKRDANDTDLAEDQFDDQGAKFEAIRRNFQNIKDAFGISISGLDEDLNRLRSKFTSPRKFERALGSQVAQKIFGIDSKGFSHKSGKPIASPRMETLGKLLTGSSFDEALRAGLKADITREDVIGNTRNIDIEDADGLSRKESALINRSLPSGSGIDILNDIKSGVIEGNKELFERLIEAINKANSSPDQPPATNLGDQG